MRSAFVMGLVTVLLVGTGWPVHAQGRPRRTFSQYETRVTTEIDRGVQQAMNDAQQLLKQQQYVPAVTRLQSVLDHPEDYFLNKELGARDESHTDVKAQTHRLLAELPAEARAAYELHFGTTARTLLNEGTTSDDAGKIAEVVTRFQTTAAGFEALQILAASAFDHDELIQAALLCEAMATHPRMTHETAVPSLLQAAFAWHLAGQADRSEAALKQLQSWELPKLWRIAGREVPALKDDQEPQQWLQTYFGLPTKSLLLDVGEWRSPRGGLTGNESATAACAAGGGAWVVSPLEHARFQLEDKANQRVQQDFDRMSRQIEQALRDDNRLIQPAAIPIIAGDLVVYRTLNDITAVDLRTGKLLWRSSVTDGMLSWLFQSSTAGSESSLAASPTTFPGYLRHKLFRDQLSGSLSTDGKILYAIEESETQFNALRGRFRQGLQYIPDPANKLTAYDLEGGRLLWEAGGVRGTPPSELSGIFFVCPPLPFEGRLYCLAEMKDELCLLALVPEAKSVRLDWSQSLINATDMETLVPPRRLAGSMPTISEGIMVCPTNSGSVVAYDLVQRQLRWGYSYSMPRPRSPFDGVEMISPFQVDEEEGRWLEGTSLLAKGRVIVTPRDSADLHCLNLVDGKLMWKRPRESGLFVACINNDSVIVVGRTQVAAYSLADGSEVWSQPIEITEPSGRGVRVNSHYLLPLSTGEIATIDLTAGRILGRSRLPDGRIPGNLAIGAGALVSCGNHDIIGFRPLDEVRQQIARQLTDNPHQPEALALRGELRLHQGEEQEAIADLRESLRQQPEPRVQRTLAGTMLTVLRNDSAGLLKAAPELERLTDEPRQRIEFLRLYVKALDETGKRVEAVRQLVRLAAIPQLADELIPAGQGYFISQFQSIRAQLFAIFDASTDAERLEIARDLTNEFAESMAADNRNQRLARIAKLTVGLPVADPLLKGLVDSKALDDSEFDRSQLLERLVHSQDRSVAAFAVATLAAKALAAEAPRDALPWIEQLRQDYPQEISLEGKTGRELSESWLKRDDVRKSQFTTAIWPAGPVDVVRVAHGRKEMVCPVDVVTHVGHQFVGWSFDINPSTGVFTARDPSLHIGWRLQLANSTEFSRVQTAQLHIHGRRLAFSQGMVLAVIEANNFDPTPKILFEKSLKSTSPADRRMREIMGDRHLLPNGRRFQSSYDAKGSAGFLIGLSDEAVFYQLDNRLIAVDAESGETIWFRTGSEFAKSDAVVNRYVTLHTGKNGALLLRPLDGAIVQQHKGSLAEMPIWFGDSLRLSRFEKTERMLLEMRNFDGDKVVWQSSFPTGTITTIGERNELAVLEPSGQFSVIDLPTGQVRMTTELLTKRPHGSGGNLALQRYEDRYIVVSGVASRKTETRTVTNIEFGPSSDKAFTIDGHVSAIDCKTGRVFWSVPVDQLGYDTSQPSRLPLLVLAARHSEFDQLGRFQLPRLAALILDKRTGRTIYETEETSPINRSVQFLSLIEDHKLLIDFQTWNLELTFAGESNTK